MKWKKRVIVILNSNVIMEVESTAIEGLKILRPKVFFDSRGYFFESFSKKDFDEKVSEVDFVQDNESCSTKGVVRGLHFQLPPFAQAKLVRCVRGEVLDIAVDIRKGSVTYGQMLTVRLSETEHNQFFIPRGFAHGFVVLTDMAVFQYKCDNYYAPGHEGGINILDPELNLGSLVAMDSVILSDKDKKHPMLNVFDSPFILGVNC